MYTLDRFENNALTRRSFLRFTGAGLVSLVFTGCGGPQNTAETCEWITAYGQPMRPSSLYNIYGWEFKEELDVFDNVDSAAKDYALRLYNLLWGRSNQIGRYIIPTTQGPAIFAEADFATGTLTYHQGYEMYEGFRTTPDGLGIIQTAVIGVNCNSDFAAHNYNNFSERPEVEEALRQYTFPLLTR